MPRFPGKKLDKDNIEMACRILQSHYGKYFVENADDLAKEVNEEFDCDVTADEVYPYVNVRPVEEEDISLIIKNVFS